MKRVALTLTVLIIICIHGCKNEVAQWHGPDRTGIFPETALLNEWPENGPEQLWSYEGLGRGFASPAVTSEQLFVNGEEEGKSFLFAINLQGELQWKTEYGEEFLGEGFSSTYPGARSTPTVYGKYVYTTSGKGDLACFDKKTGELIWTKDLIDDLQGHLTYFGYSESVAVDDENVYCFPGGTDNNYVALDRMSGSLVWASKALQDTFAYGSPVLLDLPEREVLLTTGRHHLFTLDKKTGALLASYKLEGFEYDGEHCNTPVYYDGHVYFVANDIPGQGTMKLKLSDDGSELTEVWTNNEVMNNFGGFVVVHDRLYTTLKGNKMVVLDNGSGMITDSAKISTGAIVFADDKFFSYGYNGKLSLMPWKESGMEVTGIFQMKKGSGQHFSHPVLKDGVMYVRRGDVVGSWGVE